MMMRETTQWASQEQQGEIHLERQRIGEFQDSLTRIEVQPLTTEVDINHPRPDELAREQFFMSDYQPKPTLYVVPEIAEDLANNLVNFDPLMSRGGKASGHGVFFGSLNFTDGSEMHVAVKPHFANEDDFASKREAERSCLKDYFANAAAKESGFESLQPIGFILDDEGRPYSLTALDETLSTLDSIDWSRYYEQGFENNGMRELLYKVAVQTAQLHHNGDSFHGDLAPRNIATNPFGHVFLIDWEYGNVTNASSSDIEERFGKSWKDLKSLMVSMVRPNDIPNPGIGIFTHCQGSKWEAFRDLFLEDYMAFRRDLAEQGSHHMRRLQETDAELTQLEHSLQAEMSRYEIPISKAA